MANVLRHERFESVPARPQKRRRGRLPRGVASIKRTHRLKEGDFAEIVGEREEAENHGIRVVITLFSLKEHPYCWLVKSLGRAIRCKNGSLYREVWLKDENLRRLWTGLGENERIQLRMWRGVP